MISRYYRIADIAVKMEMDAAYGFPSFREFETESVEAPEIVVEMYQGNRLFQQWYGIEYYPPEEKENLFISKWYPGVRLTAGRDWKRMVIEGCACGEDGVMEVFLAGFYSYFSGRGGILCHASAIEWKGEAVIFTAASGIGKTTQAELWERYRGAKILNGDKMLLETGGACCRAWGSPWRGSSPYARNESAPLRAVIVLEQAEENFIRKLAGAEILAAFSPHLFYPMWNHACVKTVMEALDWLLERTPVYLLACRPDQEAVELVHRTIWGEG